MINFAQYFKKFSQNLGAENPQQLYANLDESFRGDPFRSNSANVLRHHQEDSGDLPEGISFTSSLLSWGGRCLEDSFRHRKKIATLNSLGLFAAFGVSFANPIAGMVVGACTSLVSAVAEGIPKRNIASFGHLEGHLLSKISNLTYTLIKSAAESGLMSEEGISRLRDLSDSRGGKFKNFCARALSYISSPALSATHEGLSFAGKLSAIASGIFGSFVPILPLVTVRMSKWASDMRHKTSIKHSDFFEGAARILFDEKSWRRPVSQEEEENLNGFLGKLTATFAQNLRESDNHGRIPGQKGYHPVSQKTSDRVTNPKKATMLSAWIGSKITKFFVKRPWRDLASEEGQQRSARVVPFVGVGAGDGEFIPVDFDPVVARAGDAAVGLKRVSATNLTEGVAVLNAKAR
jgi:hypothetical protein